MEIEIQNSDNRLKPGCLPASSLVVEERKATLVAPKSAVVDFESKRGVWSRTTRKAHHPASWGSKTPSGIEGCKSGPTRKAIAL